MTDSAVTLRMGRNTLQTVPSIHYRVFFAGEVRKRCTCPQTRPAAVAVELGPETAMFVAHWIRELASRHFPVLLVVLSPNRLLHPSLREKVIALQQRNNCDLSEISEDEMREHLDFCPQRLLPLSPTDSIIEGIRSACAYGLALYGVDLEESADEAHDDFVIRQPARGESLSDYYAAHAAIIALHRHGVTDRRREYAMAARLKTLLERHGNVLFICGIAHWQRIKVLLHDNTVRPAPVPEVQTVALGRHQRVIIDRSLAVRFIDYFPAVARDWERNRPEKRSQQIPDAGMLLQNILRRVCRNCFREKNNLSQQMQNVRASLASYPIFQKYLGNLCLLEHKPVPNLTLTLSAAQETMDEAFVHELARAFMRFPWTQSNQFPDCGYLTESAQDSRMMVLAYQGTKEKIYVRLNQPVGQSLPLPNNPARKCGSNTFEKEIADQYFSWLPWDRLATWASLKAITISQKTPGYQSMALDTSLLEGLDIRASLKSLARGSRKLYVRERLPEPIPPEDAIEGFPVVWIFKPQAPDSAEWRRLIYYSDHLRPHIRNKSRFEHMIGNNEIAVTIGYANRHKMNSSQVVCNVLYGMTLYHPLCFSNRQQAQWLEHHDFKRVAISRFSGVKGIGYLIKMYQKQYGIDVLELPWSMQLILFALYYAAGAVTVVAPDGFKIDSAVMRVARRLNVSINQLRLSRFDDRIAQRLTRCHFAHCTAVEPECQYSREVEDIIGERQTDFTHLVPRQVSEFGRWM